MRSRRHGVTVVEYVGGEEWYVIVTPPYAAICNRHGRPHLHRHPLRIHPSHRPSVPLDPDLTLRDVLLRIEALGTSLREGPGIEDLRRALS